MNERHDTNTKHQNDGRHSKCNWRITDRSQPHKCNREECCESQERHVDIPNAFLREYAAQIARCSRVEGTSNRCEASIVEANKYAADLSGRREERVVGLWIVFP